MLLLKNGQLSKCFVGSYLRIGSHNYSRRCWHTHNSLHFRLFAGCYSLLPPLITGNFLPTGGLHSEVPSHQGSSGTRHTSSTLALPSIHKIMMTGCGVRFRSFPVSTKQKTDPGDKKQYEAIISVLCYIMLLYTFMIHNNWLHVYYRCNWGIFK